MREDLDTKLCKDFPLLYADRFMDMRKTSMCWGFPGDGWEPLIRELSQGLEEEIQEYREDCPDSGVWPKAVQVKEKFGTLRFYMTFKTPGMAALIRKAEDKSAVTCEVCGKPGEGRSQRSWIMTLCEECDKDDKKA